MSSNSQYAFQTSETLLCIKVLFFIPIFFSLSLEEDESAGVQAYAWFDNEGEAHRHGNLAATILPVTVFFFFFFFIQRLLKDKHFLLNCW